MTTYRFRFVEATHIHWLHFPALQAATEALEGLFSDGYLARFPLIRTGLSAPAWAYALSSRGAAVVVSDLGIDASQIEWRRYHNEVTIPFIEHRLAVNAVRAALLAAQKRGEVQLAAWRYELAGQAPDPNTAQPTLLIPDVYFSLKKRERAIHCLLEADLGTVSHRRIEEKVRLYVRYRQSLWFRDQIGARGFRVLFATSTPERAQALRRVTQKAGGENLFWFAPLASITPHRVLGPIWLMATKHQGEVALTDLRP